MALHDNDSIQCGDLLFVYKTIGNSEALKWIKKVHLERKISSFTVNQI
jgi:DNA polymerase II large subunit